MTEAETVLDSRTKDLPGQKYSYRVEGNRFGLDVASQQEGGVDESEMSIILPFADGNVVDGVGDVVAIEGIDTSRHRLNPICLADHGKNVPLPLGVCETPETKQYTVELDPTARIARAKVFFYQGRGLAGIKKDDEYEHALFCQQMFDLWAKKFIRGGSIGYSVKRARQRPADYERGIPAGLHLQEILMLECSVVVLPANQMSVQGKNYDYVNEILAMPRICGKAPSGMLVKSLSPYTYERTKTVTGYTAKSQDIQSYDAGTQIIGQDGGRIVDASKYKAVDKKGEAAKSSKKGDSPESAKPADLAAASDTPGTSTSTGGATAHRNTGAATGGAVTITLSGSSSTDTATTTGAGAGKGGKGSKGSGKDEDKEEQPNVNITVNSTGRSGDAMDDRKEAKGIDVPIVDRFNVEKVDQAWYVTDRGMNFAGPYNSELEAKAKKDEMGRIFGEKLLPTKALRGPEDQYDSSYVYNIGYENGQKDAAAEKQKNGKVLPMSKPSADPYDQGYERGWNLISGQFQGLKAIPPTKNAEVERASVPLTGDLSATHIPPSPMRPGDGVSIKSYETGDEVEITGGKFRGETGTVISRSGRNYANPTADVKLKDDTVVQVSGGQIRKSEGASSGKSAEPEHRKTLTNLRKKYAKSLPASTKARTPRAINALQRAASQAVAAGYHQFQDYSGAWEELADLGAYRGKPNDWDWQDASYAGGKITATDPEGVSFTWSLRKMMGTKSNSPKLPTAGLSPNQRVNKPTPKPENTVKVPRAGLQPNSAVKDLRKKYRSVKGLRRRVKGGRPSNAVVHVAEKDLAAAKAMASELGVKCRHAGGDKGLEKLSLSGHDDGIDRLAKEFGRRRGKSWAGDGYVDQFLTNAPNARRAATEPAPSGPEPRAGENHPTSIRNRREEDSMRDQERYMEGRYSRTVKALRAKWKSLRSNIRNAHLTSTLDELRVALQQAKDSETKRYLQEMIDECQREGVDSFGDTPMLGGKALRAKWKAMGGNYQVTKNGQPVYEHGTLIDQENPVWGCINPDGVPMGPNNVTFDEAYAWVQKMRRQAGAGSGKGLRKGLYRAQGESTCTECGDAIHTGDQVIEEGGKLYCTRECLDKANGEFPEKSMKTKAYELFYGSGGHDGPYQDLNEARAAAERKLAGSSTERSIEIKERSAEGVGGYGRVVETVTKSFKGKSMKTRTKDLPPNGQAGTDPGMAPDAGAAPPGDGQPVKKYSAEVLERMHENTSFLLAEYDRLVGPLENEAVSKFISKELERIVEHLEDLENLHSGEHPDETPLGGGGEAKDLDTDDDGTPDTMEADSDGDGTTDVEEADSDGDGTPDFAEADSDGDGTPNVDEADSDNDGVPDEDEAVEAGKAKALRNGHTKAWRRKSAEDDEKDKDKKDEKRLGRRIKAADDEDDEEEKKDKALKRKRKALCAKCKEAGKESCTCEGAKAFPDDFEDDDEEEKSLVKAMKDDEDKDKKKDEKRFKNFKRKSAPGYEEHQNKPGSRGVDATSGVDPGYEEHQDKPGENVDSLATKALEMDERREVGEAASYAGELANERNFGEDHRMKAYYHHRNLNKLSGSMMDVPLQTMDTSRPGNGYDADVSNNVKDFDPMDVEEEKVNMVGAEKSMHPHRKMCKDASDFFGDMSRERAFGDQHRERAKSWHKDLDAIAKEDEKAEATSTDEPVDLPEPGEMGEKQAINRLKALLQANAKALETARNEFKVFN